LHNLVLEYYWEILVKIVIPILGFGKAGGYRVLSNLATEWVKLGHMVTFLCHISSDLPYFPTVADVFWIDKNGLQIERNEETREKHLHPLVNLLCLLRGLNRYFSGYDVVLANHSLTAFPVTLARIAAKKIYYVQAYEPEYYQLQPGFSARVLEFMAWLSYFFSLKRIVNAPIYLKYKNLRSKFVVYPGLDENIFKPSVNKKIDVDEFIVGCIGRKEPQKGIEYVYEAMKIASREDKNLILHVAYCDIHEGENLPFKVRVTVPKNDQELADYYCSLNVLVAPGTVQLGAAHYPAMEAMSCGIPLVTTGYFPANQENSWIVPVDDSEAIKNSIDAIRNNTNIAAEKILIGLKSCMNVSWENVAQQMISFMTN
jgi:glycosyltransferase involved in cell wall biosynthesis